MRQSLPKLLTGLVLTAALWASAPALALGLDPAFPEAAVGPAQAKGVVVWSHGRSIDAEDSQAPTPAYLQVLRANGWDVMRFDRLSHGDNLDDSTGRLVDYAAALKHKGYKQIVLAGQSFGAFLSLMAADASADVDAVIATAPAAYGDFEDFHDSWRLNATKLYPLLEGVKRARIMVFYFHGDDFDPGGRGDRSREILAQRGLGYAVVDQPAFLTGHWASSSGAFLRRFGNCIREFADDRKLSGELVCSPHWGTTPSAELKLPPELTVARPQLKAVAAAAAPTGSGVASDSAKAPRGFREVWYGFYPNGREVLLGVERVRGDNLTAIYAVGPSVDDAYPSAWSRRKGRIVHDDFVFDEKGKSTLRFRPCQDGGLEATWIAADGKTTLAAHLKLIDPEVLADRRPRDAQSTTRSAPVTSAAAHGNGNQAEN
ncbi:MAG TPA: alpha/beta hydrolase [Stellaceae bacterium]|nr:alpha/beta hydrolase [Stellaceae bacterium]